MNGVEKSSGSKFLEGSSSAVYKHYRNNVANTMLSLSMGVIFAGVACVAIGHFLGVQDATETTRELVETLKKLQVEKAALQSQLFHLNKSLLNRETGAWLGLPPGKLFCKNSGHVTSRVQKSDLKSETVSKIRSSLNSTDWLSKIKNFIRSDGKAYSESNINFKDFEVYIQDQFHTLKNGKENVHKLLEDADRKISNVLQKITAKISIFQDNVENLYNKLIKVKNNLNHKTEKVLSYSSGDVKKQKSKLKESFDDQSHLSDKMMTSSHREHQEIIQFPQPEKYYQVEMKHIERVLKKSRIKKSIKTLKKFGKAEQKEKKDCNFENEKRKQKKRMRINKKNEKSKKLTKGQKKSKRGNIRKNKMMEFKPLTFAFEQDFNVSNFRRSKTAHSMADFIKAKRKLRIKKSKLKKCFPKLRKNSSKRFSRPCFNLTGYWAFRWADGREEYRRHQAMGEWQFERARGRKELRAEEGDRGRSGTSKDGLRGMKRGRDVDGIKGGFFHDRFSWI